MREASHQNFVLSFRIKLRFPSTSLSHTHTSPRLRVPVSVPAFSSGCVDPPAVTNPHMV